ncbi:MAG: acylphosphatase [Actinomycetota bacterium]
MKRVRVVVSGHVQGVFFRASCAEQARSRTVSGGVRNLPDGRVEATFEGPADAVDALVEWCRRGPSGARVDAVETHVDPLSGEAGFRIVG